LQFFNPCEEAACLRTYALG